MTKSSLRGTLSVSRTVNAVDVYKASTHAGVLTRTHGGCSFQYTPDYAASEASEPIAFSMPIRAEAYEVYGTNLHPFFAGLLPEGLRMRALVRSLKTSEDDLFSLLVKIGADTVGDVAVALLNNQIPTDQGAMADTQQLDQSSFQELLERSLRYSEGEGDETAIAGVQPKVSSAMITIPIQAKNKRAAYFLKLTPTDYPKLVENESFFMKVAKSAEIDVARTELVRDSTSASALLVERFDRVPRKGGGFTRIHQEDACQLLDRYPADKYRLNLREIMDSLEVCSAPIPERLKLLRLQAFSYLIVNGDMHAKNVSVRTIDGRTELTPAYDLLSTLPYRDRKLALAMEGRDERLTRKHFVNFGERIGLRQAAVHLMLDRLCERVARCLPNLDEIGLATKMLAHLRSVMQTRLKELGSAS